MATSVIAEILVDLVKSHWKLMLLGSIAFRYIYRLIFHPLAHVPGPIYCRATNLHAWYCYQTGREHLIRREMHRKYGPVIRVAPDLVEIADPKYLPIVYHKSVNRHMIHDPDLQGNRLSVLNAREAKVHAQRKRKIAHAYSMTNVKKMESHIDDHVLRLVKRLDEFRGEVFDYAPWAQYFAYDVVSDVAFGKPFGFLPTGSDVGNLISNFIGALPYIGFIAKLPAVMKTLSNPLIIEKIKPTPDQNHGWGMMMGFRDKLIEERLAAKKSGALNGHAARQDFLELFLEAKNEDGTPLSMDVIKAEALTIMMAGSDTTSTVMRELVMFLHANPQAYKKAVAEIDAAFESGKLSSPVPKYDETQTLPYVEAVLKEVLRLGGAVSIGIPREAMEPGFDIHGVHIPAGTPVAINQYISHRDKGLYGPDAEEFRPERWIECTKERRLELERYDAAWGYGSRTCLGKNLALLELHKSFVTLYRLFDIIEEGPPPGISYNREKMNYGVVAQRGIWVRFKRRDVQEWKLVEEVMRPL